MKKVFLFLYVVLVSKFSVAQITASNDTTICSGNSVQLNVTGGTTYTWSPPTYLNNTNTANPTSSPTQSITYTVTSQVQLPNQFINGDFSQGNTGFTSSYTYTLPPNVLGNAMYWVGGTPTLFSGGMVNCADHTTGVDTNQLIADGAVNANTPVWCQTVSVMPGTNYSLSGYIHPLNNTNMPGATWSVNGTMLSGSSPTPFFPCQWVNFTATWNSGVNTSATFCVYSDHLQANGNDFAIDDLSLTATVNYKDSVTITVVNPPSVFLGNDTSICSGSSLTLNAGNAGSTFLWSDNSTSQTLAVNSSANYSVTVTNAGNCSASDVIDVNTYSVSATPVAANTTCGNNNGSVTVSYSGGFAPYTFLWSNSSTNDSIENLAAGNYSVTVSDANSCSSSASAVVNPSGLGSITITSDASQICATDTAHICAPAGFVSYQWNTGETTQCISTSLAGNYYATVVDAGSCTSTSNHLSISILPVPSVSVSVNGDTLYSSGAVAYQWYFNNNPVNGATDSIYVAPQPGSYALQVTDTNGCTALSNNFIISGIEEYINEDMLLVFPNPNSEGRWFVSVDARLVGSEIEITDINGRVVLKSEVRIQKSEILATVSSGVYTLRITSGKNVFVRKLVKQ